MTNPTSGLGFRALPRAAQIYVAAVGAAGVWALVTFAPLSYPRPILFAVLLLTTCLTSVWKVNLPISLASGSTLSVSYAADLMALLLLGPRPAVVIAVVGVWAQCTFKIKHRYPRYRTAFSMGAEAITMVATGLAYVWLGGPTGPFAFFDIARPLVGAIATYFFVNTGLVAGAIALSTGRSVWTVWRDDFLWSGASFMVAGSAGAIAATVIERGEHWKAVLMIAPVYLTYRTYRLFVGRLELLEREQAARASAEQANRLKDQFLAVVSHELRTPLNAILGWADILRHGTLDEAKRERAYQAIYDSARHQAQLIDELLDVSRIMSGKLRLEPAAVDLHDVVHGALEIVQPDADKHGIRVTIDADRSIGSVKGDSARLQQVVLNLLTNAVKFTPDRGAIRVRLHRTGGKAVIALSDTGLGIRREFLPFVFEQFRQADASTTRRHGGLGLGLSIVKHLVEAHGGDVKAESDGEGHGSTFTVRLPLVATAGRREVALASAPAPANGTPEATASLQGISVLVVDDDEESRAIVAEYLEGHHASVRTAASAGQAFDVLQSEQVDVLLADIAMPDEDGYSLIRRIRACTSAALSTIPAAALTSFARDEDRQQALQAGFHLHLTKPVDPRSLVEAVANLGKLQVT